MNDMIDMSQFVEAKSDQLCADDLISGPRTITVRKVTGNDGDQPVSIYYDGDNNKPFKPCKTIRRVLLGIWGRNAADYVGRSMTIYRDDSVTFGGLATGGIRVSHMSHIDKETTVVVMKTKGKKAGVRVAPLVMQAANPNAAADWTAAFIAKVNGAPTPDDLNAYVAKQIGKLDRLPDDLRTQADDAVSNMLAKFHPTEGRDDADMGEGFNDAGEGF